MPSQLRSEFGAEYHCLQEGLSKSRLDSSNIPLGKPPTAPTGSTTGGAGPSVGGTLPASVVIPKLQVSKSEFPRGALPGGGDTYALKQRLSK